MRTGKMLEFVVGFFLFGCLAMAVDDFPSLVVGKDYSGMFYVNTTFGTPGQEQQLRVDTSQPYMWVVSGELYPQCNHLNSGCLTGSLYYPLQSTTSQRINPDDYLRLDFLDVISINGSTYKDNMNCTSLTSAKNATNYLEKNVDWDKKNRWLSMNDTSFIVANETGSLIQGAIGLSGPISAPASVAVSGLNFDESFYFLHNLKNAGVIESASYSLWVNNDTNDEPFGQSQDAGRLLLGAVDPKYYEGDLVSFDNIPFYDPDTLTASSGYPIVPLSGIKIANSDKDILNLTDSSFLQPVFIHSRYQFSYLPLSLIIQVAIQTNAVYVDSLDRWLVTCDIGALGSNIIFEFGNLAISVPTVDFLGSTFNTGSNSSLHFTNGKEACYLKMYPNTATAFSILGQSFIKNTYIAQDLEGGKIALAQAVSDNAPDDRGNVSSPALIKSNSIPYAKTNNITTKLTMYKSSTSLSSGLVDQFTASVRSDGEIFTGKTFYVTSRASETASSAKQSSTSETSAMRTPSSIASFNQNPITKLSSPSGNYWRLCVALTLCVLFGFSFVL